jgi:hypothetical protein
MRINVTMRRAHVTNVGVENSKYASEALVIHHAVHMCSTIQSSVACLGLLYVSTIYHKRKTVIQHKMCILISLPIMPEIFLILRRSERDIINVQYAVPHVKYPLLLLDFNDTWISSTDFRKVLEYQISWKSIQCDPSCSLRRNSLQLCESAKQGT